MYLPVCLRRGGSQFLTGLLDAVHEDLNQAGLEDRQLSDSDSDGNDNDSDGDDESKCSAPPEDAGAGNFATPPRSPLRRAQRGPASAASSHSLVTGSATTPIAEASVAPQTALGVQGGAAAPSGARRLQLTPLKPAASLRRPAGSGLSLLSELSDSSAPVRAPQPHERPGHRRAGSRVGRSMSGRDLELYRRNSTTGRALARQARLGPKAWARHTRHNCSVIVDLFHVRCPFPAPSVVHAPSDCVAVTVAVAVWVVQGMMRSTIVCPVCKSESVAFDPHMCLSLPVPVPVRGCVCPCFAHADALASPLH